MAGIDQSNQRTAASSPPETPAPTRERGWLLPTLLRTDALLYGRWDYLADAWERGALPDTPLPQIPFLSTPDKATWAMLTASLDAIPQHGHGGWAGRCAFLVEALSPSQTGGIQWNIPESSDSPELERARGK